MFESLRAIHLAVHLFLKIQIFSSEMISWVFLILKIHKTVRQLKKLSLCKIALQIQDTSLKE